MAFSTCGCLGGRFFGVECKTASEISQSAWKGIDSFRATYKKETMPKSAVICRTSHAYPVRKTDWCRPLTGKDGILAIIDSI